MSAARVFCRPRAATTAQGRHDGDVYPVELVGDVVTLREITLDDLDAAMAFASDPQVTSHLPFEPQSYEQEAAAIQRMMAAARSVPRVQYELAVVLRRSGDMIGMGRVGLTPGQPGVADIGYLVRADHWGRGLGTDIARTLIDFGFRHLQVHRIWAGHHPDNGASGRVLEKVGMVHEGRLREHTFSHGVWRDSIVYSILDREWDSPTG
jgi:[ribosomal protein S5]-alanine N-acetyltransferase